MFILQFILIIFLVVVVALFIVLILVRHMMWRINRKISKIFSSEKRTYTDSDSSINQYYKNKRKINYDDGEYVEFEEIKP